MKIHDFKLEGNVTEVQSLLDRGVQLNGEYHGNDSEPLSYPLHISISQHVRHSKCKSI